MAITITYTFVPNTTALSAEVNANFSLLASRATDKTGDTLTGTLNTQHLLGSTSNTYDLGGTSNFYRSGYLKTSLVLGQTTANYTLTWANPASARAISFEDPGGTDILVYKAATQTLTNKIISGTSTYNAGAISSSGTMNVSAAQGSINLTSTTGTNYVAFAAVNTGNTSYFGNEASTATVFSGSSAYAILVGCTAARSLHLATNNTVRATIDSAGATSFLGTVKSTVQPGFFAYNSSSDVTQANTATIQFDTELYDRASNFASNAFTVPVTGDYIFCVGVMTATGSATQDRSLLLDVNGGQTQLGYAGALATTTQIQITGAVIMSLTAADVVSIKLGLSTGTCTVSGGFGPVTWFSGRLLV